MTPVEDPVGIPTRDQVAERNARHVAALIGVTIEAASAGRFEFGRVMDNRACRGIPLMGYPGIDSRRNPLLEILAREARDERRA